MKAFTVCMFANAVGAGWVYEKPKDGQSCFDFSTYKVYKSRGCDPKDQQFPPKEAFAT